MKIILERVIQSVLQKHLQNFLYLLFFRIRDVSINDLTKNLKEKNFPAVRKWCVDNLDNDPAILLRRIYDSLYGSLKNASIPAAVLIIARYQYQIAFVADQEINLLAALTEIMLECEFK